MYAENAALRRTSIYTTPSNRFRARALQRKIEEEVRQEISFDPKDNLDPISLDGVQSHIKKLNIRKAPGLEVITGKNQYSTQTLYSRGPRSPDTNHTRYIDNREFTFRHENTYSSKRPIRAGVRQGATLLLLLYSAYINDILQPETGIQLALFADNTTLYLRSYSIEVNPEKSAAIYFDYRMKKKIRIVPVNTTILRMLIAPILWQRNYKYLGITLDQYLHFRDHIRRVRQLAKFYMSCLGAVIGRKNKMSLRNERTIYTMCIRPMMTYACTRRSDCTK
ncbi:Probable RNA-directed DNA polymerase from transposon BS [Eumeta japonica]|uniref:Probable RNA-directed DNA polymerase from transposon BS n=1 Tax=Eumeta variegata TaxID=151549 RepID=A0A4C1ZEY3_EUMVA|nr:Probable RNA-directed DNA polymerase from transposon BS [Eumeta japonica]